MSLLLLLLLLFERIEAGPVGGFPRMARGPVGTLGVCKVSRRLPKRVRQRRMKPLGAALQDGVLTGPFCEPLAKALFVGRGPFECACASRFFLASSTSLCRFSSAIFSRCALERNLGYRSSVLDIPSTLRMCEHGNSRSSLSGCTYLCSCLLPLLLESQNILDARRLLLGNRLRRRLYRVGRHDCGGCDVEGVEVELCCSGGAAGNSPLPSR
jgi:hypothetical protein